jgi:hypothetical protein
MAAAEHADFFLHRRWIDEFLLLVKINKILIKFLAGTLRASRKTT